MDALTLQGVESELGSVESILREQNLVINKLREAVGALETEVALLTIVVQNHSTDISDLRGYVGER